MHTSVVYTLAIVISACNTPKKCSIIIMFLFCSLTAKCLRAMYSSLERCDIDDHDSVISALKDVATKLSVPYKHVMSLARFALTGTKVIILCYNL